MGCRFDGIGAVAQVDLVDVQLEDLALAQMRLDLQRQENLVELAGKHPVAGEEVVLGDLHGDGAAASLDLPCADQLRRGPQQADRIHPVVVEEVVIFRGQKGVDEALRDLFESNGQSTHFAELGNQLVIFAVNSQRSLQFDIAQCIYIG